MYKPGTQLIINELWAAATAHKLGFEVDSGRIHWDKKTEFWNTGFSVSADKWRIPVTSDGPNAAERFLPMSGDKIQVFFYSKEDDEGAGAFMAFVYGAEGNGAGGRGNMTHWTRHGGDGSIEYRNESLGDYPGHRIIERNGIPFPQFSEVIEP